MHINHQKNAEESKNILNSDETLSYLLKFEKLPSATNKNILAYFKYLSKTNTLFSYKELENIQNSYSIEIVDKELENKKKANATRGLYTGA